MNLPSTAYIRRKASKRRYSGWLHVPALIFLVAMFCAGSSKAQVSSLQLNLAPLDGIALTPDNYLSFGLQSSLAGTREVELRGSLRYKESGLSFSYKLRTVLRPGMNQLDAASLRPEWKFSDNAFRELFLSYKVLPQGTYEYCVTATLLGSNGEIVSGEEVQDCLYSRSEDLFLITLSDPEDNAKLYEYYPNFSWVVNYPFASQLTYRIRVAEIKDGQNVVNAVTRNNPVYTERNLPQTSTTYPVYGTPLKVGQPYGWTVDAYYKGVLLGGAEPWRFTIVEDSLLAGVPKETYYVDIRNEQQGVPLYVLGKLKIKYQVQDLPQEQITISIKTREGKTAGIAPKTVAAVYGDNRLDIDLTDQALKHGTRYVVEISSSSGLHYSMPIIYVNPDFIK